MGFNEGSVVHRVRCVFGMPDAPGLGPSGVRWTQEQHADVQHPEGRVMLLLALQHQLQLPGSLAYGASVAWRMVLMQAQEMSVFWARDIK